MRFMMMVRSKVRGEVAHVPPPDDAARAALAGYHAELAAAGVLLDAAGLHPSGDGWRIRFAGGRREVSDGPFAEPDVTIAGYALIEVRSRAEALAWSQRCPPPFGAASDGEIEVRQLVEPADAVWPGTTGERCGEPGAAADGGRR